MRQACRSVSAILIRSRLTGTPVLLLFTALSALNARERRATVCFALASILHVLGVMVPTMTVNVPLNEALALVDAPLGPVGAQETWRKYSGAWQSWNTIRAVPAGCVLALAGWSPSGSRLG